MESNMRIDLQTPDKVIVWLVLVSLFAIAAICTFVLVGYLNSRVDPPVGFYPDTQLGTIVGSATMLSASLVAIYELILFLIKHRPQRTVLVSCLTFISLIFAYQVVENIVSGIALGKQVFLLGASAFWIGATLAVNRVIRLARTGTKKDTHFPTL